MTEPQEPKVSTAKLEPYSDASSSYWAPGWNWERWSHPELDFGDTSAQEIEKMRLGILEVLGEDKFEEMTVYLQRKHELWQDKKLVAEGVPPPEYKQPDFIKTWRRWYADREVGIVAFRTALYEDEAKWNTYKEGLSRILSLSFDRVVRQHRWHEYGDISEARRKFKLHWIEDKSLEGADADALRARHLELRDNNELPGGMIDWMFLCASPQASESVLSLRSEDDFPTVDSNWWRDDAPFLLAVMEWERIYPHGEDEPCDPDDPHDEANWYKPVFKVPAELVWSELWPCMVDPVGEFARITRHVKGSAELGGWLPKNFDGQDESEMWWGKGPTLQALKKRWKSRRRW
ncbi:hypothetical protein NLG97_g5460 [Lecanicillium saksenae]|uniref:Uncharacterized protein n=1 Tax=Lecanicillium saksenae TaxID=468837 RepID=A0ACC1QSD9_9HYPO|nr:hypothetical protein NLG97_g5460 [Lecanicillium saksenae]